MLTTIGITTQGKGLLDITPKVETVIRESPFEHGLCSLLIRHTSASLLVQENADPSARQDLESWLERLVPENDSLYTHTLEGADDMPAHIKSMLTQTTLSIPFQHRSLALGTWQGIYLWEHRYETQQRQIVVHLLGD